MKYVFCILVMSVSLVGFSQLNHRSAVSSAGATAEIGGAVLSYNIGQSIFSTESSSDLIVTQGLLQPYVVPCIKHTISKTGDAICSANPATLSLMANQNYLEYQWHIITDRDTLEITGANKTTYSPNHPGNYYVTYIGDFCVNFADPVPVLLDAGSSIPIIARNGSVMSTDENAHDQYQWFVDIGSKKYAIYGQNKAAYTPIFDGKYYVEVTYASGGCKIMSNPDSVSFLGREIASENVRFTSNTVYLSMGDKNVLNVYPYPSFESFTLDMYSDYIGEVAVELVDMNGRMVSRQDFTKTSNLLSEVVDTIELSEGLYGVVVTTDLGKEVTKMLIIE